jgi:hypothetical protein
MEEIYPTKKSNRDKSYMLGWNDRAKSLGERMWEKYIKFSEPTENAERNTNYDDWKGFCYFDLAIEYLTEKEVKRRLENIVILSKHLEER